MRFRILNLSGFLISCVWFSASLVAVADAEKTAGKTVVLWISDDGFRGDYVDRGQTPFLNSLLQHGVYTKQLTPTFPSLTFPSHVCEATGVRPGVHGIVSNKWFDTSLGKEYNMPGDPNLLEAEPIWLTAARQGVRTAVLDWPLAQAQGTLPHDSVKADFYNERFDPDLSDYDRLEKMVDVYRKDFEKPKPEVGQKVAEPLRLLMGYVHDVDTSGHKFGPDAPETTDAVRKEDEVLKKIVGEVADIFQQHMHPENGDALYVLITTDHGMDNVTTLVNLHNLMGGDNVPAAVRGETSGSLGNIYLNDVPGAERETVKKLILEKLRTDSFLKVWARDDLPPNWAYGNPTRTGDIVVSLNPGYDFTSKDVAGPTDAQSVRNALKGMHGYDPAEDDKMLGFMVLARWGSDGAGKNAGPVSTLQIHPMVAKLLGIQPAGGATAQPIAVP